MSHFLDLLTIKMVQAMVLLAGLYFKKID